jgi:flagellar FliL protein
MADEKQPEQAEAGKGGKKKLILIITGALVLVGLSVGATVFLLGGGSDGDTEAEAMVEEAPPEKGDPTYIELKAFTVNLAAEDPVGFLQVQIQVLTYADDVAADVEKHKPLIRNNLALLFGQQKSDDLRSTEGKQALQEKVLESIQSIINKYGSGGEVDNVFFTYFVMQ